MKEEFQKIILEMNLIPGEDGFTPYDILYRFTPRKAFDNKFDLNHHQRSNIAVHAREILNKIKNEPTKVILKSAFNKRHGKLSSRNKIVKEVLSNDIIGSQVSCDIGMGTEDSNIFKLRILDKKSICAFLLSFRSFMSLRSSSTLVKANNRLGKYTNDMVPRVPFFNASKQAELGLYKDAQQPFKSLTQVETIFMMVSTP
uniref:Site-specific DNA-methyltransferase (adenine-specific) n=1 Tax=Strongyloides venezuelensis TaxID=75913 RepID=A0A0K0FQK6_STRVS